MAGRILALLKAPVKRAPPPPAGAGTITLTFCEQAENHAGMQKIGSMSPRGFDPRELRDLAGRLPELKCELVSLPVPPECPAGERTEACVLVVRGGAASATAPYTLAELDAEQRALPVDKKALMRGAVKNKNARWNLCFDDAAQEPDYAEGKGRVVDFASVPATARVRQRLGEWLGPGAANLKAEGNYYYDAKCYIGWHGDSERRRVIGVRLGPPMPLWFQWYNRSKPHGAMFRIDLNPGDMYIMSERAVGTDWRKPTLWTLRHAAGSAEALKIAVTPAAP